MTPVLVINSGSSSLKYQVVDTASGTAVATGLIERIGGAGTGQITHSSNGADHTEEVSVPDHAAAMTVMDEAFTRYGPQLADVGLVAVGHRVVQGGDEYTASVLIDDHVVEVIEHLAHLAPLHNPANAAGIRVAREQFPDLPHVAVFDTAFHATMPQVASTYAIDREVSSRYHIRRYGFHGTSHAYVSRAAAHLLGQEPERTNVIVLHLGNGASACAVKGGVSVDTSMGLTPLEGLVMGTRSGDIDPAIVFHLRRAAGMNVDEIDDLLNKRSGMLGLAGRQDMRDVVEAAHDGDADAQLALEIYCYRIRHYIGAYSAVLGRVDAIVFTAGIGENSADVRALSVAGLEPWGIELDDAANQQRSTRPRDVAAPGSAVRMLVIPTDEELEIAREAIGTVERS